MAEVKGKGRAAAAVLVALLAVLGLPAQAALAQGPGDTIDATINGAEVVTLNVGGDATIVATRTNGAPTADTAVSFELIGLGSDDTPDAADGACVIAASTTQCSVTLAALGAATGAPGTAQVFVWFDNAATADCDAQHPACLGAPAPEPVSPDDVDNTDVVGVTIQANQGFTLDCTAGGSDSLNLLTGTTAPTITCTEKDSSGAVTTAIEIDLENLGPNFDPDSGQFSPVDDDGAALPLDPNPPAGGTTPPGGGGVGPAVPGTMNLCFFLDTNSALDDTGATGPDAGDGGDCAAERTAPAVDDTDGTDVICIAWGTGACATGIIPPPPPGTNLSPIITGAGCANGSGAVTFRPILGLQAARLLPDAIGDPIEAFLLEVQTPDTHGVSADDPDGGPTTLTLSGAPSWLTLTPTNPVSGDPALGQLRGTPSGLDISLGGGVSGATLNASDGEGGTDTCALLVAVGFGFDIPIAGQ